MDWDQRPIVRNPWRFALLFVISVLLSGTADDAFTATLYVNPTSGTCPGASTGNVYCTIQDAINAASTSDVIFIAPGIYEESLKLVNTTSRSLTVRGSGISHTRIKSYSRGFLANEDVSIEHLTIDGVGPPKSGLGGGVYVANNANVTLSDVVISNNHGGGGGGVAVWSGAANLKRVAIVKNWSKMVDASFSDSPSSGGGVFVNVGTSLVAVDSVISGNYAGIDPTIPTDTPVANGGFGAGIFNLGTTTLVNTTISGNSAFATDIPGGAITNGNDLINATLNLYNVTITGNSAAIGGGGVYNVNGTVNARNSIIAANTDDGTAPNCGGNAFFSQDYNIIGVSNGCDNTVFPSSANDRKDISVNQLDLLALPADGTAFDNIPVFLTAGLNTNSVAVDAIGVNNCLGQNNNQLTNDQRDVARPLDGDNNGSSLCDIGAYELGQDILVFPKEQLTFEDQGTSTVFVALAQPPAQTVQLNISSQNTNEGSIATPTLSFNGSDWNTPKPVQIDVQNDGVLDGDQTYTVNITASGLTVQPKSVAITNIDTITAPGLIVDPQSITIQEGGASATLKVRLATPPATGSVVNLSINNDLVAVDRQETISPSTLTFNDSNWKDLQLVTVAAIDDTVIEGDRNYHLLVSVAGSTTDTTYATVPNTSVNVLNQDNDIPVGNPGITFSPAPNNNLTTSENGGQVTISAVLNSMPSADVAVNFLSNDINEGMIQVGQSQQQSAQLVFTLQNWDTPQSITVVGIDDNYVDGGKIYKIVTEISSNDASYQGINPDDISITNIDNDTPDLVITPTSGLTTSESGSSASFQVSLTNAPAPTTQVAFSAVAQPPAPGLPLEGSISLPATQLVFTSDNYNVPQTVTVFGVDDNVVDCSKTYNVTVSIDSNNTTSAPYLNSGITGTVSVTNTDNDVSSAPQIVFSKTQLNTSETGTSDSFNVCLTTQPSAPVTINMAIPVGWGNEGAFSGNQLSQTLIIDQNNWTQAHSVTVIGVDDTVADGAQTYNLVISAPISSDPNYANQIMPAVSVTNADDEEACKTAPDPTIPGLCTETTVISTSEDGGSGEFRVKLVKKPSNLVTVKITVSDTTEGSIADPVNGQSAFKRLTFSDTNWNTEQSVTIVGIDDTIDDGNITYQLELDTSESFATEYQSIALPNIRVVNQDNDRAKPNDPNAGGALHPGIVLLLLLFTRYRNRFGRIQP